MRGVAFEPGVKDAFDLGVAGDGAGDGERGGVLALDTDAQRLEPARDEKRGVGVEDGAEDAPRISQKRDEMRRARDDAAEDVVVAGQVLRRAVDDQIDPEAVGAAVDGRRERGIDEGPDPTMTLDAIKARKGVPIMESATDVDVSVVDTDEPGLTVRGYEPER